MRPIYIFDLDGKTRWFGDGQPTMGECRIKSPTIPLAKNKRPWPEVWSYDFCGEWGGEK